MIKRKDYIAGCRLKEGMQEKLVLSPLPISTQEQPFDTVGNMKEKTNVYLDVGGGNTHVQIELLGLFTIIMFSIFLCVWLFITGMSGFQFNRDDFLLLAFILGIFLIGEMLFIYGIWQTHRDLKKSPFLRFNRQHREVAVPFGKKNSFITIPWESLYVWVETATVASDTMMASTSILMFTMANPDNEEEFWSGFQLGTGGHEANCVMLWECIRHFMEEGPEACPESNQQANLAEYIRSR
ncbi:hypothetical protein [Spartinivicinus poritis]|uniref:Transmembrane protein n=1 Tax=Spartinivicinus poritis TaxID=2994640 RepID=A0ABT5UGD0_9GAMM|nr:hypothetical protein [Spartinivicinus sp. A2-2]MDE1464488.1 hypothetical protein [Spartinivicinus sp. A2-2]